MIEPAIASDLARIAASERDVRGAYQPGFEPESSAVARPQKSLKSDDPLSVAAPEGTYFVTGDASGKLAFSRNGSFAVVDGELRGAGGRPVLGFTLGEHRQLGALRIDRYDVALRRISQERIEPDGTFEYTRGYVDPRSGERKSERVTIGRVALGRLPAGTEPQRVDAFSVRAPQGVAPHVGLPGDGSFSALAASSRDAGRVDIIAGLERMKESYVAFEALRSAHHARAATDKTALDLVK